MFTTFGSGIWCMTWGWWVNDASIFLCITCKNEGLYHSHCHQVNRMKSYYIWRDSDKRRPFCNKRLYHFGRVRNQRGHIVRMQQHLCISPTKHGDSSKECCFHLIMHLFDKASVNKWNHTQNQVMNLVLLNLLVYARRPTNHANWCEMLLNGCTLSFQKEVKRHFNILNRLPDQ